MRLTTRLWVTQPKVSTEDTASLLGVQKGKQWASAVVEPTHLPPLPPPLSSSSMSPSLRTEILGRNLDRTSLGFPGQARGRLMLWFCPDVSDIGVTALDPLQKLSPVTTVLQGTTTARARLMPRFIAQKRPQLFS
ncbi:hypothetical protein V1264_006510 [Littorina saxatilis]|uniref:Uncharacterized protein n=1 Tax=Littorina saxatilis TaxID=31220 RepID=A0AAN9AZJ0_9CAEN